MLLSLILTAAATAAAYPASGDSGGGPAVVVHDSAPDHAGEPVLQPFVSFSIEFAWFPAFAGNISHPNHFSNQLLENLGDLQGEKPIIRVGGNTQDFALYDPDLQTATNGTVIPSISKDYPRILYIGPSYFQSYQTWPNTQFIHGFNLGANGTEGMKTLMATATLACKALGDDGKLLYWELGNEPDLFARSDNDSVRPTTWFEEDYVREWLNKTSLIQGKMRESCGEDSATTKYIAPSFASVSGGALDMVVTWENGFNKHHNIAQDSAHNYMGGAEEPGVTLQGRLMNHTEVIKNVEKHTNVAQTLNKEHLTPGIPYILGEMNSLYHQGRPGLSNSFGAALWGVDFNLYCAANNIRRTHMHQGLNYRYAAWQPEETDRVSMGTKAPYYGNAMVAAMLRGGDDVRVVNVPLGQDTEAAYAAYVEGKLARIAVVNMKEFNYTTGEEASEERPNAKYSFRVPGMHGDEVGVQRLLSNGSNAVTGITWDGWSYNYELKGGVPVRLDNVTIGETVSVDKGVVEIEVPYSSGAILNI